MHEIIDFLNSAVFFIGDTPTSWAEIFGFIFNGLAVWLVARNNILTFPVGILGAAFFFVLFIENSLYSDAWLQMFFLVIQVIGWGLWLKAGPNRTELRVGKATWPWIAAGIGAVAIFAYLMVPVLREAHGAYPVADSTSTGLSVVAQTIMSFRLLQHWYFWIVADLIYIPVYFLKDLYFTSALYIVFLILCVMGLRHWKKIYNEQHPAIEPEVEVGPVTESYKVQLAALDKPPFPGRTA